MQGLARLICTLAVAIMAHAAGAQACETEAACLDAYAAATVDRDIPIDLDAANVALSTGCEVRQTGKSCRILSHLIKHKVVQGSQNDVERLNRYGCEAGDRIACRFLVNARVSSDTWGATRGAQSQQIREMLEDRCVNGDDYVCRVLVRYITDEDAARYAKRCDAGETAYCALLGGHAYYPFHERGALANRAEGIFRQQCEGGEGLGCIFLSDLLERGHGQSLTEDRLPHVQRACDLGIQHGCDVSHLILSVREPKAPRKTLDTLMQRSCDLGNVGACLRMTTLRRWTSDANKIAYAEALRDHCLIGDARACESAASAFEAIRRRAGLDDKYADVDQMIENYFQFAKVLKGR